MSIPDTQYARAGDTAIAYQVYGSGPHRMVVVPGIVSNVELIWEWLPNHRFFDRLGSFATVAQFDKRGTGGSDRIDRAASVEERMEDFCVVMDTVGWDRATVYGLSEGGSLACLFAATYPERTERLVLQGAFARLVQGADYEIGPIREVYDGVTRDWAARWGTPETLSIPLFVASQLGDDAFRRWWTHLERLSSTPANFRAMCALNAEIDIRHILGTIRVPTLVLHARQDLAIPVGHGHYLAANIPGATLSEYDGEHFPLLVGVDETLDTVEEFLTGSVRRPPADRVLATVMFTDICGSTGRAATIGDRAWRALLDRHDDVLRGALARHGGVEVKTTGDGMLSTFDSPTHALRCGLDMIEAARSIGVDIRVGVHTGEIERRGGDVAGVAVHIGARVAAVAGAGDLLASAAVPPLVVGSGLDFADRGEHDLKGVPGRWRLYAVKP